jgi:hypothetical protein
LLDAQIVEESSLDFHHVAHGNRGKIASVRFSGNGIDAAGPSGATATAEQVWADYEQAVRIDSVTGAHDNIPPTRIVLSIMPSYVRVATNGMANQDCVIAHGVELAVGFVSDGYTREVPTLFQIQRLVESDRLHMPQWSSVPDGVAAFENGRLHKRGIFYAVGGCKARHLNSEGAKTLRRMLISTGSSDLREYKETSVGFSG